MRLRRLIISAAIVTAAAVTFMSWMGTSVDASGQFAQLPDGAIKYTHRLSNLTWHPVRYIVAGDPQSAIATTLVTANSSQPEKMVTRIEPSDAGTPWSVTLVVPGHQEASIEVIFRAGEPLTIPEITITRDMGGVYPAFKVLLGVGGR